jgi:transposase
MGRLPEAWIAPPATRELRGWVRHRAKLVGLRSSLKNQIHAVLAAAGVAVPMSDLIGPAGQQLLVGTRLAVESRSRVDSLLRVIEVLDFEIDTFARLVTNRLRADPGYAAIQQIPGVGPLLGGGVRRRDRRHHPLPTSWAAGLVGRADPAPSRVRHHRAPRPDHQDGMWRPQPRPPCPKAVESAGRSSCQSRVGSIFIGRS